MTNVETNSRVCVSLASRLLTISAAVPISVCPVVRQRPENDARERYLTSTEVTRSTCGSITGERASLSRLPLDKRYGVEKARKT